MTDIADRLAVDLAEAFPAPPVPASDDAAEEVARAAGEAADNRVAIAKVIARGMCRAGKCRCHAKRFDDDRYCIAWGVWGDLALAGVVRAEAEGWFLLPTTDRAVTIYPAKEAA